MLASQTDKRNLHTSRIIKHLFFEQELSCAEISEKIDRSIPLTTQYINGLLKAKKIKEKGYAHSTGGRRPQTYAITQDSVYVIAVGMDQMVTRIAVINERNEIVGSVSSFELALAGNPRSLDQLKKLISDFVDHIDFPRSKIVGIGIGMPGFVDAKKGLNHSFLQVETGSIAKVIEEATKIPVFIDNDSSLIALAELKWGAAKNRENVMVINVGWGVGLGIITNGRLFRGSDGFAGEFSHIPLFENNKLCSCGKYGCLETETSMKVVVEKAGKGLKEKRPSLLKNISLEHLETSARDIIEAVKKGDKFSIEVLSESAYNIGRGVAILIHLLNPELVVISGIGSLAGRAWIAPIQQAINEHCIPKIAENTSIEVSGLGYNAELIGAAALVMDNYDSLKKPETDKLKLKKNKSKII